MKNITVLALLSIFALTGCDRTPTNVSPGGSGTSIGHAYSYDAFGIGIMDNSDIKVSLEGTNISAYTDTSGKWELKAPSGSYVALVSKDGYVTKRLYNVEVPTSGIEWYIPLYYNHAYLFPIPNFLTAKSLVLRPFEDQIVIQSHDSTYFDSTINRDRHVYVYDTTYIQNEKAIFSVRTSMLKVSTFAVNSTLAYYCHLFCSKNSDIDPENNSNDLVDFISSGGVTESRDTVASFTLRRSALINAGFHSGDRVFCAGFSTPTYLINYNYDPSKDAYFPTVFSKNHTEVKSFILP